MFSSSCGQNIDEPKEWRYKTMKQSKCAIYSLVETRNNQANPPTTHSLNDNIIPQIKPIQQPSQPVFNLSRNTNGNGLFGHNDSGRPVSVSLVTSAVVQWTAADKHLEADSDRYTDGRRGLSKPPQPDPFHSSRCSI